MVALPARGETLDAGADSADADESPDAAMNPPDEDDPGSGCSCFWTDELPEGTAALGLPWVPLLIARRATKSQRSTKRKSS